MSESLTPNFSLSKFDQGDNPGAVKLNANWTKIDSSMGDGGISSIRNFFSANSFLPSTKIKEAGFVMPTVDFQNFGAGSSMTQNMSLNRVVTPNPLGTYPFNYGWDLGAEYNKVLFVMGFVRNFLSQHALFISDTLPSAVNLPNKSYVWMGEDEADFTIQKTTGGGSYTSIASETDIIPESNPDLGLNYCMGFYYQKGSPNILKGFIRLGSEVLFPLVETTDTAFTTMRYVGIMGIGTGTGTIHPIFWTGCPFLVYAE